MMSCTPRALAGNLNREQRRDHAGNLNCYCPKVTGPPAGILGRVHGCMGCQELRSAAWSTQLRAADRANRARAAAHRDAVAKGTSPDHAPKSHTQLMPALGPPASASRFPARTHPSRLKGPSCAHVHTALPGARRSPRLRAENKWQGYQQLAPHPSPPAAGSGTSTAGRCSPAAVEPRGRGARRGRPRGTARGSGGSMHGGAARWKVARGRATGSAAREQRTVALHPLSLPLTTRKAHPRFPVLVFDFDFRECQPNLNALYLK